MAPRPAQLAFGPWRAMKIAIVCPYDLGSPGGVQKIATELARHLAQAGDEAFVVAPGRRGATEDDARPIGGVVAMGRSVRVPANGSKASLTISPLSFRRLRRAIADADVIHIHEPMIPFVGWAALRSEKPKVVTFHADAPRWAGWAYQRFSFLERRMGGAVLTAVSETARKSVPPKWGEVRIIPNAIDTARYDVQIERNPRRVAFLGRDEPRKGLDIALGAFVAVRERHPDAELVVMSDVIRDDDLAGVKYFGRVSEEEKRRLLASSAIYIAPNTGGESFGIVLAEALAAGCAVVASDLDAFREVVGDNGVLFPVGDSKALAGEIVALLDDPDRRETLGKAGQSAVQRFDWAEVLDDYREAYSHALAR